MRLFTFTKNDFTARKPAARKGHGPQWTFKELAEKWSLSIPQLMGLMLHCSGFPDAGMRRKNSAGTCRYYDLHAALVWYNTHKEKITAFQHKTVL